LWKEYSNEFWKQINLLTGAGYTVYFISHETTRKLKDEAGEDYEKLYPSGDKRSIDPVCDLVDVIAYAKVNGIDKDGNEIKSSLHLINTKEYHAGSRFDYLMPVIKEFTAENLQKAIADAVKKQEEVEGVKSVDFKSQQEQYEDKTLTFEELQEEIKQIVFKLNDANRMDEYKEIVENYLGIGGSVKEATKKQRQSLELILDDLKELDI
jgi:hypothetical protein